jgi:hypothetical protein
MKKLLAIVAAISLLNLTGCTESVPPAHYGKIHGVNGYSKELLSVGRHTVWGRDNLVLLDASTHVYENPVMVTMKDVNPDGSPRPGLEMQFAVKFRYKMKPDAEIIDTMFNDIKVADGYLGAETIYGIYGDPIIDQKSRELLSRYTPEEALANREIISKEMGKELTTALRRAPIEVSDVVVSKMVLPKVIKDRINKNKDRELALAEENAKQAIKLAKQNNEIVLANKRAERELIDAKSLAAQNVALGKSATPEVIRLRELAIQEIYANAVSEGMAKDGNTTFLPFQAMGNTGAQVRMFNTK